MKKTLVILFFVPIISICQDNLKFAETININDLEKHLNILASDSLEGRETGKIGQKKAAAYIANHFKKIGIKPPTKYPKEIIEIQKKIEKILSVEIKKKDNIEKYYQKFKVKTNRHLCKLNCSDCDTDFISKLTGANKWVKGENVLGYIEGTDLKKELLIITAHYDHLGKHDSLIFNGADDNASGTAAVLEIAEAFMLAKKNNKGPRRSILIMPVSGEEKGLLGSKYYTEHPIFPLKNTIANLNIDMIGRVDEFHDTTNYIYLIGSDKLSKDLHNISEEINKKHIGIKLDYTFNADDDPNRYYYRSDHYNFAKNNIPVIFYFNGVHEDYHQITDTAEKINFKKMETITRLVFLTAWEIANRDEKIKLNK